MKPVHIAGDFNLTILDHDKCSKVHNFFNLLYENCMIPTTNKPTRVTRKTSVATDRIFTNQFINDCNWTRTQNHLVLKRTLNHLAKLAK